MSSKKIIIFQGPWEPRYPFQCLSLTKLDIRKIHNAELPEMKTGTVITSATNKVEWGHLWALMAAAQQLGIDKINFRTFLTGSSWY